MKNHNIFKLKHFDIIQNLAAMKLGTDAILLGAWADASNSKSILDIGTGTGILALQLAQRYPTANISAIDIDKDAYQEAKLNFNNSPWKDRLICHHNTLEEYEKLGKKHDFIICNPPYYDSSYKPQNIKRAQARHRDSLDYESLLSSTKKLLSNIGMAAFIIPNHTEDKFLDLANSYQLYPTHITNVKGNINAKTKRSLIQLSNIPNDIIIKKELIIETKRHQFTEEYISLVKEFYLDM